MFMIAWRYEICVQVLKYISLICIIQQSKRKFHILAQPCNILSINTCTRKQYHNDLHVFTRIMTTNPMSRNTSTTELIMDNQ